MRRCCKEYFTDVISKIKCNVGIIISHSRVAESVVTLLRRNEPSKDLVSQFLSSKLTCEREMAQKALELLLTAQNAFERERERDQLTRLLTSCSQLTARSREREREISSQGS